MRSLLAAFLVASLVASSVRADPAALRLSDPTVARHRERIEGWVLMALATANFVVAGVGALEYAETPPSSDTGPAFRGIGIGMMAVGGAVGLALVAGGILLLRDGYRTSERAWVPRASGRGLAWTF
jgi:hypothetical protein